MRISTKVSFSLALLGLVVFGGLGALQVRTEKRDLERAFVREASTLCRATAEALRQDLRDRDPDDSTALLQSLERFERDLDVMVWPLQTGPAMAMPKAELPRGLVDEVGQDARRRGELVSRIAPRPDGGRVALVASPIDPSREVGVVVLARPLDTIDADLWREAQMTALSVLLFSVLGGMLGFVLGEVYIGRPLAQLDRAMTAVAEGGPDPGLSPGRADEVGRVLDRFDRMRRELQRAHDRLQREQDAHRTTLERLAEADRLVTVGQVAAGLAHEIGSPLQILHGRAQKLAGGVASTPELARGVEIIVAQIERITRIVRQLLQLARPRARERRPTDPAACIAEVVDLLDLEARRREVSLGLDVAPDLPLVDADPDALQQVVFNLARNGLAALEPGGWVRIRLDVTPVTSEAPRTLELVVTDNGRGMSDELRAQAFEPFFTTRAREGGVGLGLAVVRSLVHAMGGSVTAHGRAEGGTEFVVRMPC